VLKKGLNCLLPIVTLTIWVTRAFCNLITPHYYLLPSTISVCISSNLLWIERDFMLPSNSIHIAEDLTFNSLKSGAI